MPDLTNLAATTAFEFTPDLDADDHIFGPTVPFLSHYQDGNEDLQGQIQMITCS